MALLDGVAWEGKVSKGGAWTDGRGGTYAVVEPATGNELGTMGQADAEDVAEAAASAAEAQKEWAALPHTARAAVLRRAGDLWAEHADEIRDWNVREVGAIPPMADFAIHVAAEECYQAASLPGQPIGQVLPSEQPRLSMARQLPAGVVAVISPFNVPIILGIRSVAPALALGNAVLLKPDPRTAVTRAPTSANAAHLSPAFLDEVLPRYAGTRLGRQEIDGEIIEDRADALWTRDLIEAARVTGTPPLLRLVIGVDPPGSARPGSDACGIVAAGIAESGTIYVLADATVQQLAPHGWASAVVALFSRLGADLVVAEGNQGGDMVRAVLQQIDPAIPVRTVHATRGKWLRAEPVAMRYQQGKVRHVDPPLQALEDQMCDFGINGLSSGASPDRLDALVWAVTDLMKHGIGPRITIL